MQCPYWCLTLKPPPTTTTNTPSLALSPDLSICCGWLQIHRNYRQKQTNIWNDHIFYRKVISDLEFRDHLSTSKRLANEAIIKFTFSSHPTLELLIQWCMVVNSAEASEIVAFWNVDHLTSRPHVMIEFPQFAIHHRFVSTIWTSGILWALLHLSGWCCSAKCL